jgi:hypothetical protein
MGQVSNILFWEMGGGVGRKSIILLVGSQVSSAHLSDKISMKIKTIHGAKVRADSTDASFYFLLNAEVRNLGKKKQLGCFRAIGLIDLSGGLHYKQAVAISKLRIVSAS